MKIFRPLSLIVVSIVLSGCSTQNDPIVLTENGEEVPIPEHLTDVENVTVWPANRPPTHRIHFEQTQLYGEMYSSPTMMFIGPKVAVDHLNRVFVADVSNNVIKVYGQDGALLKNVSRSGRGPGELSMIGTVKVNSDYLYVFDGSQQLIHFYSLDSLNHSHTVRMNPDRWQDLENVRSPREFEILDDGTIIIGFVAEDDRETRHIIYYRFDTELNRRSEMVAEQQLPSSYTFTAPNGMAGSVQLPSTRKDLLDFSDDGSVVKAWTDELAIQTYTPIGEQQSVFYSPYENKTLNPQDIIDIWGDIVKDAAFPETWPVLEHLLVDGQNRIWAATIIDDRNSHEWWIIDNNQKLLAKFVWPSDKEILQIKNGNLFTKENPQEGASQIVRYQIQLTPNNDES